MIVRIFLFCFITTTIFSQSRNDKADLFFPKWVDFPNHDFDSQENAILHNKAYDIDTSMFPDFFWSEIEKNKGAKGIETDKNTYTTKGIVKNSDGSLEIKELTYKVQYLYNEICGGGEINKCNVVDKSSFAELLCLFKQDFEISEGVINLDTLGKSEDKHLLPSSKSEYYHILPIYSTKNILKNINYGNVNYQLEYKTEPTMIKGYEFHKNVQIRLKSDIGTDWQLLYKNESNRTLEVSDIIYGDIDSDLELDFIVKICREGGCYDIYYLSTKKDLELYLKHIGQTFEVND